MLVLSCLLLAQLTAQLTTQQDHQRMLDLLNIKTLPTSFGLNLISAWRQKWKTGSHAFLNRFPHPPGTPLSVLRQQNSSTNRHSYMRRWARTKSITYRLRSPSSACALIFKK
jgi:hypothetical protein